MIEFLLAASMMLNEEIGSVKTSGLFLKDSIQLNYFVDLNYESISCYVTQPKKKSLSFTDQSNSSIDCKLNGEFPKNPKENLNIFSKSKSVPFYKSLKVARFLIVQGSVLYTCHIHQN